MATAECPVARAAVAAGGRAGRATRVARSAGAPAMDRSSAESGRALARSGSTLARRIMAVTSDACAVVCTVTEMPAAPARAVRPDRCT
jgi:hypothetical protein